MANAKKTFLNWYQRDFLSAPLPSQEWDKQIAKAETQKAIISSQKVRKIYKQTEIQLVHDYTDLVDAQLRKAFATLDSNDLANPVGFTDRTKGSDNLQNYFKCRDILEQFIGNDITGHSQRDAQLHAFHRWVEIASLSLKKHRNYEAYSLIVMRLFQIDGELQLSKELPKTTQKAFKAFEVLLYPLRNFKALREHIQAQSPLECFMPTFLLSKDMVFLNEILGDNKNLHPHELNQAHPAYEQLLKKETMLLKFKLAQSTPVPDIAPYLQTTFTLLSEHYEAARQSVNMAEASQTPSMECSLVNSSEPTLQNTNEVQKLVPQIITVANQELNIHQASRVRSNSADTAQLIKAKALPPDEKAHERQRSKSLDAPAHAQQQHQPSKLYTTKLLPSFWHRGCSEKRYWEKLYEIPANTPK